MNWYHLPETLSAGVLFAITFLGMTYLVLIGQYLIIMSRESLWMGVGHGVWGQWFFVVAVLKVLRRRRCANIGSRRRVYSPGYG